MCPKRSLPGRRRPPKKARARCASERTRRQSPKNGLAGVPGKQRWRHCAKQWLPGLSSQRGVE
jgi:hypothetical protein